MDIIKKLSEKWYKLIGGDHHKDRDCHFQIVKEWSYGDHPKWYATHNGYITELFSDKFDSYETCETWLIDNLKDMLKNYEGDIND